MAFRDFHIQSEHDEAHQSVTSTIYYLDRFVDSITMSYREDIKGVADEVERKKIIKAHMVRCHRTLYKRLFDGEYGDGGYDDGDAA